jgi:predicted tellurium resistance membrane protein TerC
LNGSSGVDLTGSDERTRDSLNVEWLNDPQIWASLLTLTALEIVLGIDNLVFITILAGRLPADRQNRARQLGLALALVSRLALLGSIA